MLKEEFIIKTYCLVDDTMKKVTNNIRIRRRGPSPALSDSEVVTMEIVGEFCGIDTDEGIHQYFKSHWTHFFPKIGDRTAFARQSANLWHVKQIMRNAFLKVLAPFKVGIKAIDSFPMPVCNFRRAGFAKIFKGNAAHGFCASKNMNFYGFRNHVVVDISGIIEDCSVAPANIDERELISDMEKAARGVLLGDRGYICKEYRKEELEKNGVLLLTPLRDNMKDDRPRRFVNRINNMRRIIETVFSQMSERLNAEKIRARDIWHLTVRIGRKILAHTLACVMNMLLGNPILQFERILT